eukprot:jgi/Chrzof1/13669/Cz08g07130.t1
MIGAQIHRPVTCFSCAKSFKHAKCARLFQRHLRVKAELQLDQVMVSRRHAILSSLAAVASLQGLQQAKAEQQTGVLPEGTTTLVSTEQAMSSMTPTDKQVFTLNRRVQTQNRTPIEFPAFIRDGFNIKVVADGYQIDDKGLIYKDFKVGEGSPPSEGQEVVFDYTGYNESGAIIDSSYRQGRPAQTRLGIKGLIPGFEEGIKTMRIGGKRRIVVPPELGPPVGPSTFFSAKQCEVRFEQVVCTFCNRVHYLQMSHLTPMMQA